MLLVREGGFKSQIENAREERVKVIGVEKEPELKCHIENEKK